MSNQTPATSAPMATPPRISSKGKKANEPVLVVKEHKVRIKPIAATCFCCRKLIQDDQYVLSTEQAFHINCFACSLCKKPVTPGNHTIYDRHIYCRKDCVPPESKELAPQEAGEHYGEITEGSVHKGHRISQRCEKCKLPVRGTDYVVSLNIVWHRICLVCALCNRHLIPGDHTIHKNENETEGPFCKYPCYQRRFLKPFKGVGT